MHRSVSRWLSATAADMVWKEWRCRGLSFCCCRRFVSAQRVVGVLSFFSFENRNRILSRVEEFTSRLEELVEVQVSSPTLRLR